MKSYKRCMCFTIIYFPAKKQPKKKRSVTIFTLRNSDLCSHQNKCNVSFLSLVSSTAVGFFHNNKINKTGFFIRFLF